MTMSLTCGLQQVGETEIRLVLSERPSDAYLTMCHQLTTSLEMDCVAAANAFLPVAARAALKNIASQEEGCGVLRELRSEETQQILARYSKKCRKADQDSFREKFLTAFVEVLSSWHRPEGFIPSGDGVDIPASTFTEVLIKPDALDERITRQVKNGWTGLGSPWEQDVRARHLANRWRADLEQRVHHVSLAVNNSIHKGKLVIPQFLQNCGAVDEIRSENLRMLPAIFAIGAMTLAETIRSTTPRNLEIGNFMRSCLLQYSLMTLGICCETTFPGSSTSSSTFWRSVDALQRAGVYTWRVSEAPIAFFKWRLDPDRAPSLSDRLLGDEARQLLTRSFENFEIDRSDVSAVARVAKERPVNGELFDIFVHTLTSKASISHLQEFLETRVMPELCVLVRRTKAPRFLGGRNDTF